MGNLLCRGLPVVCGSFTCMLWLLLWFFTNSQIIKKNKTTTTRKKIHRHTKTPRQQQQQKTAGKSTCVSEHYIMQRRVMLLAIASSWIILSLTLHTLISLKEVLPPLRLFPRRVAHKVIVWHYLHLFLLSTLYFSYLDITASACCCNRTAWLSFQSLCSI